LEHAKELRSAARGASKLHAKEIESVKEKKVADDAEFYKDSLFRSWTVLDLRSAAHQKPKYSRPATTLAVEYEAKVKFR
jgi:hypothetical protein